jgi:lysozyme family protein
MREFNDYFEVILEHEGGFSDHSADPGGATNYGISLLFLKDLSLEDGDIDGDGDIDRDDILALTIEDSKELYHKFFWNPLRLDGLLSEELKLHLFDHGVNAGTKTAVKLLQRILGLQDDGVIGKDTTRVANSFQEDIIERYKQARKDYYSRIIERNPKLEVFRKGWFRRVDTTKF